MIGELPETIICRKCGKEKKVSEYYIVRDRGMPYYRKTCKKCYCKYNSQKITLKRAIYHLVHYSEFKKKQEEKRIISEKRRKEYIKIYRENNKEKISKRLKKYYNQHLKEYKDRNRIWRERNRERYNAYHREYQRKQKKQN